MTTIFNVMVNAVVCHWESLMTEGADRDDISGNEAAHPARCKIKLRDDGRQHTKEGLKVKAAIFYADAGMLACTNPGCLQTAFGTMMGLFDWVGLKKDFWETVRMVCHPFRAAGVRSDKSYTQQMKGEGRSYKERQR